MQRNGGSFGGRFYFQGRIMTNIKTFMPNGQVSVSATATITSARLALDQYSNAVRLRQAGTAEVYIQFGDSTVTATTSHMPVGSGSTELFSKGAATHVAFITAAGTASLTFTSGEGI